MALANLTTAKGKWWARQAFNFINPAAITSAVPTPLTAANILQKIIVLNAGAGAVFNVVLPEPLDILTELDKNNIYDAAMLNEPLEFYLINNSGEIATLTGSLLGNASVQAGGNVLADGTSKTIKLVLTRIGSAATTTVPAVPPQMKAYCV